MAADVHHRSPDPSAEPDAPILLRHGLSRFEKQLISGTVRRPKSDL
jgi:hypothetical protein